MSKQKYFWVALFLVVGGFVEARLQKPSKPVFDVLHYRIEITLNERDLTYQAKNHIRLRSLVPGLKTVSLHFRDGFHTANLPIPLKVGEEVTMTVPASGKASEREQGGLFVVRPDPNGLPQFFTQFESQGARKVFPCFDEPFEKATTEVILTASDRYTLLSNGRKISEEKLPEGLKKVHFKNEDPISTYHITIIAAELTPLRNTFVSQKGNIPLAIYTRPGQTRDVRYAMDILKKALKFYEGYFGIPYPWDSYGIVAVPGFTWSGMENKGLANLNEAKLLWNPTHTVYKKAQIAALIAHELAHEWFGNLVTMHWWDDLWLNEAFATFMAGKFEAYLFGEDYETIDNFQWLATSYFPQDQGPLSHAIVPKHVDTLDEMFDSVTYAKGVQVVRMLEDLIGKEAFREGLKSYFKNYALGNATTENFLKEMEVASSQKLDRFAKTWLHQKGYPQLALKLNWDSQKKQYELHVNQPSRSFEFKINIGEDFYHIHSKKHIFVLSLERSRDPLAHLQQGILPVNRDGRALCQYEWEGFKGISLNDIDPFVRFETTYKAIQEMNGDPKFLEEQIRGSLSGAVWEMLVDRLSDTQKSVALGISWTLIDNKLDPAFAKEISKSIWREARQVFLQLSKQDPIEAQLRRQLLTLLGQADIPELNAFLKEQIHSDAVDDQLGSLAGLLRSQDSNRYAVFEQTLQKYRHRSHMKLELLKTLALTPRKEVLAKLNKYLLDTELVSKDDSSTPIYVWRVVSQSNRGIVYSKEGIQEVARFVKENLDRASVAGQALRTLEEVGKSSKEVKKDVRVAVEYLLKMNPPDYIESLGRKILTAAR